VQAETCAGFFIAKYVIGKNVYGKKHDLQIIIFLPKIYFFMRPDLSRVSQNFHNYINHVPEDDLAEAFEKQSASFIRFLDTIPHDKYDYRYAENKWTIREVLQHRIDPGRIFAYRALRFVCKDSTAMQRFAHNSYS